MGYEAGMHAGKSKPGEPQSEPQRGGLERETYERAMLDMSQMWVKRAAMHMSKPC